VKRKRRAKREAAVEKHVSAEPHLRRRTKVVFSSVAVLLALVFIEGASRVFVELTPNARWQFRSKLATTLGFPALDEIVVPNETLFWTIAPNLNKQVVSGRFRNSPFIRFCVSTDSRGFRRMPGVESVRHRVLFLGDSCTFGLGVEDEQTFPALLQERLPGVQCINAAATGYTAYQGRVLLERLKLDGPLDAVVIIFGRNDDLVWDHLSDVEHAELISREQSRLVNRFRTAELVRHALPRDKKANYQDRPARPRLTDDEYVKEVATMIQWCHRREVEPILVIWPLEEQVRSGGAIRKQALLTRLAHLADVRLVDLVPVFRTHGGSDLFLDLVHANSAGCEVVADALLPVLSEVLAERERFGRPGPTLAEEHHAGTLGE
jgi:lysophospholipase L1-like esterase